MGLTYSNKIGYSCSWYPRCIFVGVKSR